MARKFLGGKPVVGTGTDEVVVETLTITATAPVTIDGTTSADLSANRTIAVSAASTSAAGVVQLSDSTSTTSSTVAATSTAVKAAYDAVGKQEAFGSITSTSGTIDYDYATATTFYHTSSPTADWTVNFTNVPTTNNFAYNFSIVVPQGGTAYKVTAAQIGGSSATIKWAGSTAAPVGNNSKTDIWIFSLFRVSGAWTVLGVQSANFG